MRVESEGAYAAPALDAALEREPALSAQDRALCTELVYGVLRTSAALDERLGAHASKPGSIAALDAYTRAVLRVAAYQVLLLERIPTRAAVSAAVDALTRDRSKGMAGFANALLRKVSAERVDDACAERRVSFALASVPPTVRARLAAGLGSDVDAESVLRAMFERRPSTDLRAERTRCAREELARVIEGERPDARITLGGVSPLALRVSGAGDLRTTEAYRARGLFAVQEEGAQCVALATGVKPGMRVLDACAGRGGKSALLASMMGGEGLLHAVDAYPEKVARGRDELSRLGLLRPSLEYLAAGADLTRGLGPLAQRAPSEGYDVVLVDAPCSGLGTLARRPELIARRATTSATTSDDDGTPHEGASRVAIDELQREILKTCASLVRLGGTLLYAVCTLTEAEGEGMRQWFLRESGGAFEASAASADEVEVAKLRPATVMLRPDRDGTDGFVLWRARRVRR